MSICFYTYCNCKMNLNNDLNRKINKAWNVCSNDLKRFFIMKLRFSTVKCEIVLIIPKKLK
jgi:hypothetical protein